MKIKRPCDNCTKTYIADTRDLNRGWGKCCSKSCAASAREKSIFLLFGELLRFFYSPGN